MKYTPLAVIFSALTLSLVLLSGKAEINFNHTPNINNLLHSNYYKAGYENGTLSIYLKSAIKDPDGYTDLIMLLNKNRNLDKIRIYLSGNGGSLRSALDLYYAMQNHPANIVTIVRGDVYSAHAMIALAGDEIKILNSNILFLFHIPAGMVDGEYKNMGAICEGKKGKDRGISKKHKCKKFTKAYKHMLLYTLEKVLIFKLLTEKETNKYYSGHNVLLTGGQVIERLNR